MSKNIALGAAQSDPISRALGRATDICRIAMRNYMRLRYRRATLRVLRSMDERLLRDIGLDPDDLRLLTRGRNACPQRGPPMAKL